MTDTAVDTEPKRNYWLAGNFALAAKALTGVVAILVALKAIAYEPSSTPLFENQDHFFRILAFAALTVWTTLTDRKSVV